MAVDVLLDRTRYLVADWQIVRDTSPEVTGRDVDLRDLDQMDTSTRRRDGGIDGRQVEFDSGTAGHTELCPLGDQVRPMPGRQIPEGILTHQKHELRRLMLLPEEQERLGRVRRAATVEVNRAHVELGSLDQREIEHRQTMPIFAENLTCLVRWLTGRNEEHRIERQGMTQFGRDDQVPDVRGIECPAKNADSSQPILPFA